MSEELSIKFIKCNTFYKIWSMNMNKKGSMMDVIFTPMWILIIACTIFICFYIWGTFSTNFAPLVNATSSNQTSTAVNNALSDIQISFQSFDYMFPFVVGGLLLVSLIFAFKTGSSVIYAFMSLIFWAFALMFSTIFTNIFGNFALTFPTVASSLPIISYIMDNMKWIVLFWCFLISTIMFTRSKNEDKQLEAQEAFVG